jgi:hypothetical protein
MPVRAARTAIVVLVLLLPLVGCVDRAPTARVQTIAPTGATVPVAGRVVAIRSAPVAGALLTFTAEPRDAGCGRCGRLVAARTGADGRFAVRLAPGDHLVACTVAGARCRLAGTDDDRAYVFARGVAEALRFVVRPPIRDR